jgi:hypothetical protein
LGPDPHPVQAFRWTLGSHGSNEIKNATADQLYDGDDVLTQALIKSSSMKDARVEIAGQFAWLGQKKVRHAWTGIDNESFVPGHGKGQEVANGGPRHMGGYFAGFRVDIRWKEKIYK